MSDETRSNEEPAMATNRSGVGFTLFLLLSLVFSLSGLAAETMVHAEGTKLTARIVCLENNGIFGAEIMEDLTVGTDEAIIVCDIQAGDSFSYGRGRKVMIDGEEQNDWVDEPTTVQVPNQFAGKSFMLYVSPGGLVGTWARSCDDNEVVDEADIEA